MIIRLSPLAVALASLAVLLVVGGAGAVVMRDELGRMAMNQHASSVHELLVANPQRFKEAREAAMLGGAGSVFVGILIGGLSVLMSLSSIPANGVVTPTEDRDPAAFNASGGRAQKKAKPQSDKKHISPIIGLLIIASVPGIPMAYLHLSSVKQRNDALRAIGTTVQAAHTASVSSADQEVVREPEADVVGVYGAAHERNVAVRAFLEDWQAAWESGTFGFERYASYYHRRFQADYVSMDRREWLEDKRLKADRACIEIGVDDVDVGEPDHNREVTVRFQQTFVSDTWCDVGEKVLRLRPFGGSFKIVGEEQPEASRCSRRCSPR